MYFTLFITFLTLSLVLIAIGLFRPEHTELSLVGFLFLFLLSLMIIAGELEYKTGEQTNVTYSYDPVNISILNATYSTTKYNYTSYTSHNFGYWLAVGSIVGFIGVLLSLRPQGGVTA